MPVADAIHGDPDAQTAPYMTKEQVFTGLQIFLAIFFPPAAVFLECGCGTDLVINVLLCLVMLFPGILHALYIVWSRERELERAQQRRHYADPDSSDQQDSQRVKRKQKLRPADGEDDEEFGLPRKPRTLHRHI